MKSVRQELIRRIQEAMNRTELKGDPVVRPSQDEKFGDYHAMFVQGVLSMASIGAGPVGRRG